MRVTCPAAPLWPGTPQPLPHCLAKCCSTHPLPHEALPAQGHDAHTPVQLSTALPHLTHGISLYFQHCSLHSPLTTPPPRPASQDPMYGQLLAHRHHHLLPLRTNSSQGIAFAGCPTAKGGRKSTGHSNCCEWPARGILWRKEELGVRHAGSGTSWPQQEAPPCS